MKRFNCAWRFKGRLTIFAIIIPTSQRPIAHVGPSDTEPRATPMPLAAGLKWPFGVGLSGDVLAAALGVVAKIAVREILAYQSVLN